MRDSLRGCAVGRSGSGKTFWIWRRWIANAPRVLIVDQTGEWKEKEPHARFANGLPETLRALREAVTRSHWRIVCSLDPQEIYALCGVLIPVPDIDKSPVIAMGGFMLYLDEVDLVVPINAPVEARSIYRRSRHAKLSVLSATQAISNVSKEVTRQCDFIGILAVHEPADVEYLTSLMGSENADDALTWANQPHHVALWLPQKRELVKLLPVR